MNFFINNGTKFKITSIGDIKFNNYESVFSFTSRSKTSLCKTDSNMTIEVSSLLTNRELCDLVNNALDGKCFQNKIILDKNLPWDMASYHILKSSLTFISNSIKSTQRKTLIIIDDSQSDFIKEYDYDGLFFTKLTNKFDFLFVSNSFDLKENTSSYNLPLEGLK